MKVPLIVYFKTSNRISYDFKPQIALFFDEDTKTFELSTNRCIGYNKYNLRTRKDENSEFEDIKGYYNEIKVSNNLLYFIDTDIVKYLLKIYNEYQNYHVEYNIFEKLLNDALEVKRGARHQSNFERDITTRTSIADYIYKLLKSNIIEYNTPIPFDIFINKYLLKGFTPQVYNTYYILEDDPVNNKHICITFNPWVISIRYYYCNEDKFKEILKKLESKGFRSTSTIEYLKSFVNAKYCESFEIAWNRWNKVIDKLLTLKNKQFSMFEVIHYILSEDDEFQITIKDETDFDVMMSIEFPFLAKEKFEFEAYNRYREDGTKSKKKNTFDFIKITFHCLDDTEPKDIIPYKNKFFRQLFEKLAVHKSFKKFHVPVNILKISNVVLTYQKLLVVTLELKDELLEEGC